MSNIIEKITIGETEYDICDKDARSGNAHNSFRIGTIEEHLDIKDPFETVGGYYWNEIRVPHNAKQWAKITKIGGNLVEVANRSNNNELGIASCAKRVIGKNGVLFETPPELYSSVTSEFGLYLDKENSNYIFFENGRAYYHEKCFTVPYDVYNNMPEEFESYTLLKSYYDGNVILAYSEPIITDVTSRFEDYGLNVDECCYIPVEPGESLFVETHMHIPPDYGLAYPGQAEEGLFEIVFEV